MFESIYLNIRLNSNTFFKKFLIFLIDLFGAIVLLNYRLNLLLFLHLI